MRVACVIVLGVIVGRVIMACVIGVIGVIMACVIVIMRTVVRVIVIVTGAHQTRTKSSPIDVVDPASTLIVSSSRSTAAM